VSAPTADAAPAIGAIAPKPAVPWVRIVIGAVVAAIAVALPYQYEPATNKIFSQVLFFAVAAMGLNLLTGFNGQVSIGHGAFFGVGAFTSAILVVDHGWYLEATIPVAALLAAALGVAVGVPALRVKGLYLALLTLGLAVMFPGVMRKYVDGPGGIPLLTLNGKQTSSLIDGVPDDIYRYYLCLGIMVALFLLASNLMRSRTGRAMIAVRDQEVAASTVGIDVARTKVITFAISAAYAGVAGSLSVLIDGRANATPQSAILYFQRSIEFLIMVVIGGAATITGPLLGAALLVFIQRQTEDTKQLAPALLGGALIAVVYVLPDGLVGGYRRIVARIRSTRASGAPPPTPSDPTPSPTLQGENP
jgi:branched-chain amino acid transport system permease protein